MAFGNDKAEAESSADEAKQTATSSEDHEHPAPHSQALQYRPKESPRGGAGTKLTGGNGDKEDVSSGVFVIEVQVPLPERPWEYLRIPEVETIDFVIGEVKRSDNELWYKVVFEDGREKHVTFEQLLEFHRGVKALELFNSGKQPLSRNMDPGKQGDSSGLSATTSGARKRKHIKFKLGANGSGSVDEEASASDPKRQKVGRPRISFRMSSLGGGPRISDLLSDGESPVVESRETRLQLRRSTRNTRPNYANNPPFGSNTRSESSQGSENGGSQDSSADSEEFEQAGMKQDESNDDILYVAPDSKPRRLRASRSRGRPKINMNGKRASKRGRTARSQEDSSSSDQRPEPTRRSGRTTKATKSMKEIMEDEEIFADDSNDKKPQTQIVTVREIFEALPRTSHFRVMHNKRCDTCDGFGDKSNKGLSPLIYCQGCSTSIHRACLGPRSGREHVVTKVQEQAFVMQCRRCIGGSTGKDFIAPRLDLCKGCKMPGEACGAFSQRKTPKQEEKLREQNGGIDPITTVDPDLLNNAAVILFRCIGCRRGFHFEHLPPLNEDSEEAETVEDTRDLRFAEYSQSWKCKDCQEAPAKVQGLVAWRPADIDNYIPGQTLDLVNDDDKEFLIKWEDLSYFRSTWMPGAWVWGVTATSTRASFARRDEGANTLPKMSFEDAIPEEFLRMEIVLDVKYSSRVNTHSEEIDKARLTEVEEVFVKFQGLGYDEVVWESPPNPSETERWNDFVTAYNEYIAGKYFKQPQGKMKEHVQTYRAMDFNKNIVLHKQPACVKGGEMMEYQLEGLNWLLYNFHQEKNVVLADEMGLGKTIQVIAAIATLVKEKPKCWPFLVVVPNSTCPNWRREIKKWAPSLRVVAYYGIKKARDVAMKYELFPEGCSDLRAHVVVTSYEAPVGENGRTFFHKIKWAGLIVDEGQRLKNDKNLLYGALSALKIPFRVLLTGTPLQNNKRELFNLLQFLDNTMNAARLDEEYDEMTNENLSNLHKMIRPYFLRRTKAQVLKFLPPMAQVIVPVTMSVVQKKLYKSILARSPDLIRSIFVKDLTQLRATERGNLNNILMQLRKVLCHPFIFSEAIEERTASQTMSYRNLVDASAKLQLLEMMLPKLQERGHRVLIFSQFLKQLDIIEDFLDGLGLAFQRLDGNVGSLEKQKRIDSFNAPDSPLFAFLLSTRAGGVGINLATADTVIIMDPDFNPHQDIQALSRAHRIGQKKKVLVFQLMTKDSAEEKIFQIGRKKMALDHALIESMDVDDDAGLDLQSILKHGAQALFDNDDSNDIRYDSASVDKLLDRSQVENTNTGDDESAESQFSYARIWANDTGTLTDNIKGADSGALGPNTTLWDQILKQREADAAREAAAQEKQFGRGRRMRQNVDYKSSNLDLDLGPSPEKWQKVRPTGGDSDTDFTAAPESGVDEEYASPIPSTSNPHEKLNGGQPGVTKNDSKPSQSRQGMAKKKLLEARPPKDKTSARNGSAAAAQKAAARKAAARKAPAQTVAQKTAAQTTAARKTATGKAPVQTAAQKTATQKTATQKTASQKTASQKTAAQKTTAHSKTFSVKNSASKINSPEKAVTRQPSSKDESFLEKGSIPSPALPVKPAKTSKSGPKLTKRPSLTNISQLAPPARPKLQKQSTPLPPPKKMKTTPPPPRTTEAPQAITKRIKGDTAMPAKKRTKLGPAL